MTIARIKRIKKVGDYRAFQTWTDEGRPKEFARVNLIYGTNGSGKSTLASLLRECAEPDIPTPPVQLGLEVEAAGAREMVNENDPTFWPRVRVFNADYVRENLRFDEPKGPNPSSLLTLGKRTVDAEKELKEKQARLDLLQPKLQPARNAAAKAASQLESRLTSVAGTVVADLKRSPVSKYQATNKYQKTDVRKLLDGDASVFEDASADLAADRTTATSPPMHTVTLEVPETIDGAETIETIRGLLEEEVVVKVIEALRGHEDRSKWVQAGIPLHAELDTCLFCAEPLSDHRKQELADHFSSSLITLQQAIDDTVKSLDQAVGSSKTYLASIPKDAELYPDLAAELQTARAAYKKSHAEYAASVKALSSLLTSKRDNPFGNPILDDDLELISPSVDVVNEIMEKHEERRASHMDRAEKAARRVELALVKSFVDEYDERKKDVADKDKLAREIAEEIRLLSQRIIALQNVSADPLPMAQELTKSVERLLGRGDLKFTSVSDEKHYAIERNGAPATNLSEGERTAIALLHFLSSVRENVVTGDEPIIVIDDPVSSLDDSILFGASAFLWAELVNNDFASQVFLLTHNFELFRQWIIQLDGARRHLRDGFSIHEIRMRYRTVGGATSRVPQFDPWTSDDKMSKRLRSLYHFLFARVANTVIEASPDINLAERMELLALAPNAARKMMEAFLGFRYPGRIGDFHNGMKDALGEIADQSIRIHVERYLHAYSHNEEGNVSSVVDPSEATVVLRSLFEMMKIVDPNHLSAMCEALSIDESELLDLPAMTAPTASPSI